MRQVTFLDYKSPPHVTVWMVWAYSTLKQMVYRSDKTTPATTGNQASTLSCFDTCD